MRSSRFTLVAAVASLVAAASSASTARAGTVGIDGIIGSEWSGITPTAIQHQAGAPTSNFGSPSTFTAGASYNLYVRDDGAYYYIAAAITGDAASSAGNFGNFYLDINPNVSTGSELIFEVGSGGVIGHTTAPGQPVFPTAGFTSSAVTNGVIELAIANENLRAAAFSLGGNGKIVLSMSQTFGYSVAGGSSFGPDGLGAASVVPEPLAVAGGLSGLSLLAMKRRR